MRKDNIVSKCNGQSLYWDRYNKGITLDEMWRLTGIPIPRLLKIELGEDKPTDEELEKITTALDLTIQS